MSTQRTPTTRDITFASPPSRLVQIRNSTAPMRRDSDALWSGVHPVGTDVKIVPSGEYKDCLLVQQHRYFVGGGSYDWFWLVRPDGKELGPVGEDTENFLATNVKD